MTFSYETPRPDLKLDIDAFDKWGRDPKGMKKKGKKRSTRRRLEIPNARHFYYVRLMAVDRGDAGRYRLKIEFEPDLPPDGWPPKDVVIPDPPALPTIDQACTVFDK
jgi:hypothetical protein